MNCHEAIDRMGDALEGTLAAEASAGLGAHLAECAPCRTYLDQLRLVCGALRLLPGEAGASGTRSKLIATFRGEFSGER